MSSFTARFAILFCLLVFRSGQGSPNFWRHKTATLPSNPNSPYYQKFQKVPPAKLTAKKLMFNFLHVYPSLGPHMLAKRQSQVEDIVVVMDGSGSIGSCEFKKGKIALSNMMELASASPIDTKYAAVTFANVVRVNFRFLPYHTAANRIMTIPYPAGMTNTQAGLKKAKELFDNPSSGRRLNSRKMVFLVTDGQSNVWKQRTIPEAQNLKRARADIFVVAVGTYIRGIDEMVRVASFPPEKYLFRVKNLHGFLKIINLVIKQVSPTKYTIVRNQYQRPC